MATKEIGLKGLSCANCANQIEIAINKLSGVQATVNFMTKSLRLEGASAEELEQWYPEIERIVRKIEPSVSLQMATGGALAGQAVSEKKAEKSHKGHNHDHRSHDNDGHDHGGHDHGVHDHGHEHGGEDSQGQIIKLVIGGAIFLLGIILKPAAPLELLVFGLSYLIVGWDVLVRAVQGILAGQVFSEFFLMAVATVGAFVIGEYPEGVAVMLFYMVGEFFQDKAVDNSRKSISALLDIRPDYANLKVGEKVSQVSPESVQIGDIIVVKPGEKVPLDGKVVEGQTSVDTSALTGESKPRNLKVGDDALSGFINQSGLISVEVTKPYGDSTIAKILDLVQNASSRKAPTEQFIAKFARYYTPVVVFAAIALAIIPPLIIKDATFSEWIYRALTFLVISCPCALVISIPLSYFGGIGGASRQGILVKGSNYLDALNKVKTVVFDKTGTLTKGEFEVTEIHSQPGFTEEQVLEASAYAEQFSGHPIAVSIVKAYKGQVNKEAITDYQEVAGHGIVANIKGKTVLVGNYKLLQSRQIKAEEVKTVASVVYVAIDQQYAGYLLIEDAVKEDAAAAIQGLKAIGVKRTAMLSGDLKEVAQKIGKAIAIDQIHAELLPQDKVNELEKIAQEISEDGKLLYVGDGINDAPVLARADVGAAMGGLGSDAAIEAADMVIMTDEPSKLVTAIKIAKKTRRIVIENISFALGVKLLFLIMAAFGITTMWEAVFADVGVSLLAILNAMRVMRINASRQEA